MPSSSASSVTKSSSKPPAHKASDTKNVVAPAAQPASQSPGNNTISGEDYQALVDKCHWLQSHLRNLDHQLNSATFRLQSVQDQRLSNCWFALSLVELRRLTNLVVRLMFELQTATMGKSVNTDYYKYALDQLCYFEFLWRCYFVQRILALNNQFRAYMTKHKQQTKKGKSSRSPSPEEDPLISIMKDVQPTLANVDRAKKRRKKKDERIAELDVAKEDADIRLDSGERDLSRKRSGEEDSQRAVRSGESLEATRLDSKTADLLDSESREAADLIALGQLEASMRVNQQLMECIRNHVAMAKVTIQNIQESGERSLHHVERTSRTVQLTKQISKLAGFSRWLGNLFWIVIICAVISLLIIYLNEIRKYFNLDMKEILNKIKKWLRIEK